MKASRITRSNSGVMGSLVLVTLVLIILATGAIAVDIAHVETIKTELQNACDAAALAGARDLVDNYENAEYSALSVAAVNTADGRPLSNTSPDTLVTALSAPPDGTEPGTVQVSARMSVRHLLAPIFGRSGDTVVATALAGSTGSIVNLYKEQAFPLAVSLDAVPKKDKDDTSGRPLYSYSLGETFPLYINSQKVKNAAFTSLSGEPASASFINDAIDKMLGLPPKHDVEIPAVSLGTEINLINGVAGQKHLADEPTYSKLLEQQVLILPVVLGDPAMNQSRPVAGFIGVQVVSIETNSSGGVVETINCRLVKTIARGSDSGWQSTGNATYDAALQDLSPVSVKLMSSTST